MEEVEEVEEEEEEEEAPDEDALKKDDEDFDARARPPLPPRMQASGGGVLFEGQGADAACAVGLPRHVSKYREVMGPCRPHFGMFGGAGAGGELQLGQPGPHAAELDALGKACVMHVRSDLRNSI